MMRDSDARVLSRIMAGHTLNGELEAVSDRFRSLVWSWDVGREVQFATAETQDESFGIA